MRDRDVKTCIRCRQFVYRRLLETNVGCSARLRSGSRNCQLPRFDVDAQHFAWLYGVRETERDRPRAAPTIDYGLPGRQVGGKERQLPFRGPGRHPATSPFLVAVEVAILLRGVEGHRSARRLALQPDSHGKGAALTNLNRQNRRAATSDHRSCGLSPGVWHWRRRLRSLLEFTPWGGQQQAALRPRPRRGRPFPCP